MAFVKGTQIFTDSGWQSVEDLSGSDKVLVRNFIGDAEFIQPFALKKREYSGEIVKIGGKNWNFDVTPDHLVVYERNGELDKVKAEDMTVHQKNRIRRSFKYTPSEEYKPEKISINDEFGRRWSYVSNDDWFTLMGYALCRAKIERQKHGRAAIQFLLDNDKRDDEILLLGDILDRISVKWSLLYIEPKDKYIIRVDGKNTLANRLALRLGSKTRKSMYLTDKVVYNSSKQLCVRLIESIISASKRAETPRGNEYQLTTSNVGLIDTLTLLGTLSGYGMSTKLLQKAGTDTGYTILRNNSYNLTIRDPVMSYSPTFVEKTDYNGYVYKIDLFDGQVYVKTEGMPVWVNPK